MLAVNSSRGGIPALLSAIEGELLLPYIFNTSFRTDIRWPESDPVPIPEAVNVSKMIKCIGWLSQYIFHRAVRRSARVYGSRIYTQRAADKGVDLILQ